MEEEVEGKISCSSIRLSFCLSVSPAFFIFCSRYRGYHSGGVEGSRLFLDVTLCTLKSGYPRLEGSMCFHLQGQADHEDSPWTNDADRTTLPNMGNNVPDDTTSIPEHMNMQGSKF